MTLPFPSSLAAILFALGVTWSVTAPVHASGTSGGYEFPARQAAPRDARYDWGKALYAEQLGCRRCPMAKQRLNRATAKDILADHSLLSTLNAEQADAVRHYLRRRFKL